MNTLVRSMLLSIVLIAITSCAPVALSDILPTIDTAPEDSSINNPVVAYTLSSSPTTNSPFVLEGVLNIVVNGRLLEQYQGTGDAIDPITLRANLGSSIVLQLANPSFGLRCANDAIYVRREGHTAKKILNKFQHAICANGVVNQNEAIILE